MSEEVKPVVEPKVEAPKVEAPPKVETPKVEPKPAETLLGKADQTVSEGAPKEAPKEGAEKAPVEAKVVPEKYDLKLPDGSALNPARVEKIALFAKENGLSQDEAQRVVERESDAVADFAKGQNENYERTKSQWLESSKSDSEIGGEHLKESVHVANSVIEKYGSTALRENLNATGLGNHPELIRMMVKIGREMGPDKLVVAGSETAGKPKPTAERVWGYMNEGKSKAS